MKDSVRFLSKNIARIIILSIALIFSLIFSGCDEIPVKDIYIEGMPESITIGDSVNLKAVITPVDATDKSIDWFTPTKNLIDIEVFENDKRNATITALSVGTAMIVVSARDGNIVKTLAFQILPRDVTLTLGNIEREYNSFPQAVEVLNAPTGAEIEYTYTLRGTEDATTQAPTEAGVYDVQARIIKGGFNGQCSGVLTIKKQEIIIQAVDKEKEYGDGDPALIPETIKGKTYAGARVIGSLKREQGEDVGEYEIVEDEPFTIIGENSANYEIVFHSGIFKINKAQLNMVVIDKTSQYGSNLVDLEYTVSGFKNDENQSVLIGELSLPQNAVNVGIYDIINDITAQNYSIISNAGKYTITKAPIKIIIEDKEKIKNTLDPEFTWVYDSNSLHFVDSDVIISIIRQPGEEIGTYTIGAIASNDDNYDITFIFGTLTIVNE